MVEVIGQILDDQLVAEMSKSPVWGLMVDEATDISVTKQLGLVVSFLGPNHVGVTAVKTRVLHLGAVSAGDAATLYDTILRVIRDDKMLPTDKLASFASDGAAVMIGRKAGVGKRLQDLFPGLVTVHCVAHRLNLAVSDCIKGQRAVQYLTKYARTVGTIFWFYQASSNRTSSLKDMERLFEIPQIKLQGGNATRWESNKEATDVMHRILPALIADLSLQARNEPTAEGLYNFVKDKFFPPALCLMQLVHEKIHRQFLVFQKRNLFFSQVEQEVTVLKASLAQLMESNMVKDRWQAWLQSDVMVPFLTALTENIDNRFPNTGSLSVFSVFSPRQILANLGAEYGDAEMRTLAEQFPRLRECDLLSEWSSYRLRVGSPDLKTKSLEEVLLWLVSAESTELYPTLSLAAAIALTAPVQTADVERLFSALKIVKTPLCNRLKERHLDVCCKVAIDGPDQEALDYQECMRRFYKMKNRRLKCSLSGCEMCR
ncbi:zinc finger protein 862-like isoform X2 [Paramormyrops kingsleyae]